MELGWEIHQPTDEGQSISFRETLSASGPFGDTALVVTYHPPHKDMGELTRLTSWLEKAMCHSQLVIWMSFEAYQERTQACNFSES